MDCQCGCGEVVSTKPFRPGHDQKLRTQLERRVGGLSGLRSLVEAAESFVAGETDSDALAKAVGNVFKGA